MVAPANSEFVAQLVELIDPLEFEIGRELMREEIPPLFGTEFNTGNWNTGHVVLKERNAHILLVTLNKQGKAESHRYLDRWIDDTTFYWQSQKSTKPRSARGRGITQHRFLGIEIHLFVRPHKLRGQDSLPFHVLREGELPEPHRKRADGCHARPSGCCWNSEVPVTATWWDLLRTR